MYDYEDVVPGWKRYGNQITSVYIDYGITTVGENAFANLHGVSTVYIGETVIHIYYGAFKGCDGFAEITIPASVEIIVGDAFGDCTGLKNIYFEGNKPQMSTYAFNGVNANAYYTIGTSGWENNPGGFGGTLKWDKKLGNYSGICGSNIMWTLDADGILTLTGTGQMTTYEKGKLPWNEYMPYITAVRITDGILTISPWSFIGGSSITSVTLSKKLTSIPRSAFSSCSKLSNILIPASVVSIEQEAFQYCTNLFYAVLTEGLKKIGLGAFDCCNLHDINIPASVTEISRLAFARCPNSTEITVKPGNKNYKSIDGVLFSFDGKELCEFPCVKDGEYTIPTGTESIKEFAFSGCYMLSRVNIPSTVNAVKVSAFEGCTALHNIVFAGNAPVFGNDCFKQVNASAYYPAGNKTWTSDKLQNYGGKITWVPYTTEIQVEHAAPVITTVANHADYMIVSWGKVEGATSYQLAYREGNGAWQSMDVTLLMVDSKGNPRVNLKNLKQGANYTFIAYALFADGSKTKSASATQTRLLTPNVQVKAGNGYVNLTWNEVQGGSQYKIYYREKGGSWQLYAWVKKGVTSINIKENVISANGQTPLIKGHTYEFAVILGTSVAGITSGFPTTPVSVKY